MWLRPTRAFAYAVKNRLPRGFALPILSGPLRGSWWLIRSATYSSWLGRYERDKQVVFARHLRPGAVVFDIGAHVGLYSLLAAKAVGPAGKVFAFEPLPSNIAYLRRHLALNRVSVEVIEAAAAESDGAAFFEAGSDTYTGRLGESGSRVNVVAIDSLRELGSLPDPDLVKIDVEGAESRVLKGALKMLRRARPTVFLAVHSQTARDECIDLLRANGYVAELLGTDSEFEFICRSVGLQQAAQSS